MTMKKKVFVRPVSINLSEDVFQQIYHITEKEEISISDYIRDAVEQKLSKSTETNS
jgi:metal-responsive CopG/Arc/MetJ family transcriptional regulator